MFNLIDYSKADFVPDADVSSLGTELNANYQRKTSIILFRHGHRTPFKYGREGFADVLEKEFYSKLDTQCFDNKSGNMVENIGIFAYTTGEPFAMALQFDEKVKQDGMLTSVGTEQLRSLGSSLKERYSNECSLLSKEDGKILTVSTKTERTIESLKSVLCGLFGNATPPELKILVFEVMDDNWLLIPYRKYPELIDALNNAFDHENKLKCIPGYREWSADFMSRTNASVYDLDLLLLRDYVTAFKTFDMMNNDHHLFNENDLKICNKMAVCAVVSESVTVPKGVNKVASDFFHQLLEFLQSRKNLMVLLSAHDTTINFVKLALKGLETEWPDFGANIEFELYEHNLTKQLFILVLYNLKPVILKDISKDNKALIPFEVFVQYVKDNIYL